MMLSSDKPGYIVWDGFSRLDGETPVRLVLTGLTHDSQNSKTGAMVQSWILVRDQHPAHAIRDNTDRAICGDCRYRGDHGKGRTCYVSLFTGMGWVRLNLAKGTYSQSVPEVVSRALTGKSLRVGSYGDPAAVPIWVWDELLRFTKNHTGYTHQWRQFPEFKRFCMASVDSVEEYQDARAAGWRTFRVRQFDRLMGAEPLLGNEVVCPASMEGGKKTTCAKCSLCRGQGSKAKQIAIVAHGREVLGQRDRFNEKQLRLPIL